MNPFLTTTGPHLIEPDVDEQTSSRYILRSHTQQKNCVEQTNIPIIPESPIHHLANLVLNEATGQMEEYRNLIKVPDKAIWQKTLENYLGHLAQGVGSRIPKGKKHNCLHLA